MPLPTDCEGSFNLKTQFFDLSTILNKMDILKFWSDDLGKKWAWGPFNFRSNAPSPDLLGPLFWYNHSWKKKTTNKHASVICFLAKIAIFHIFADRSFKGFCSRILWYAKFDGAIFFKIPLILGGASPLFQKSGKLSQACNFWWVALNLMNLIYLESA
jgi:hypothetical protein